MVELLAFLKNISLTAVLAVYGALLSSLVFGWNLYRDLTNRGKLKVSCWIGQRIIEGGPEDSKDYLVYTVTNVGRQPILVTHVGGTTKPSGSMRHNAFMVATREIPRMLHPGEYVLAYASDLSILDENLISLWALDSLEKHHKVKRAVTKQLVTKAQEKGRKK
jgi:hypothetical protein